MTMRSFNDVYPYLGPAFWIASLQYFIMQAAVAAAWRMPFSLSRNTISDLGNSVCGKYGGQFVCSPQHVWMNISFVVLGLTMMAGASLIYQEFRERPATYLGFGAMTAAGFGTIMVGIFPENTIGALHFTGALLPFLVGNLGMTGLGLVLPLGRTLKAYSVLSGLIALIALGLFETHQYLGLGVGGMERVVAYPQTLWLIVFGIYMSRSHYTKSR